MHYFLAVSCKGGESQKSTVVSYVALEQNIYIFHISHKALALSKCDTGGANA